MTSYFSKVTKSDYQEVAFKKVVKIHNELPSGNILVFLTGKKEINYMCQRLRMTLNKDDNKKTKKSKRRSRENSIAES